MSRKIPANGLPLLRRWTCKAKFLHGKWTFQMVWHSFPIMNECPPRLLICLYSHAINLIVVLKSSRSNVIKWIRTLSIGSFPARSANHRQLGGCLMTPSLDGSDSEGDVYTANDKKMAMAWFSSRGESVCCNNDIVV